VSAARKSRWKRVLTGTLVVAVAIGAWVGWDRVRPLPEPTVGDATRGEIAFYESDLGSSNYSSLPRVAFEAIPVVFPELLPEGWEGVGIFWKDADHDQPPVGFVRTSILGIEAYAPNCAVCHAGKFNGQVVAGLPNLDFDVQLLTHTLQTALLSGRLTVDAVNEVATKNGRPMGAIDRAKLGVVLGIAKAAFAKRPVGWFHNDVGPGRSDALAGWKRTLGVNDEHTITWVDLPAIFNQRLKQKTLYDGSVTGDFAARIMLTELQKGRPIREPLLHREVFDDLVAYMEKKLEPPKYPFPVDATLAQTGRTVFEKTCSKCHGTYGENPTYPNKRIDVERVGTDPERALAMTDGVVKALEAHEYKRFLKVEPKLAYMPPALNGVYMTAPYLHNGSVPTLWHMLQDPEKRPLAFYRRWNEFDPKHVGIACEEVKVDDGVECAPDPTQKKHDPRTVFRYDTRKKGNRNTGHPFASTLSDDEKTALLEYLKTI
jgi:mono/diheme cytochrome c family protein